MSIGEDIRIWRMTRDLTLIEASKLIGISSTSLSRIENEKSKNPNTHTRMLIAAAIEDTSIQPPDLSKVPIGVQIRYQRKRMGLTIAKTAKLSGIHRATLYNIETGKNSKIQDRTLKKLSDALQTDFIHVQIDDKVRLVPRTVIGEQVYRRRRELSLSISQLAKLSGIPAKTIQDIEDGTTPLPERHAVLSIVSALQMTLSFSPVVIPNEKSIGETIHQRRIEMAYSLAELAQTSGLSIYTLRRLESDSLQRGRLGALQKVAPILQITLKYGVCAETPNQL